MKITKQARRDAKQLFAACKVNGLLDEAKVRQTVQLVIGYKPRSYKNTIMVTTLAPCWYCSGLVRQFGIGTVIVGESVTFQGGIEWLRENGVLVIDMDSSECKELLGGFITEHPEIWNEDIGEE